jgi:hypothetical protein
MPIIQVTFNETDGVHMVNIEVPEKFAHRFVDIISLGMLHAEFHGEVASYPDVRVKVADGWIDYTNV